VVAVIGRVRPLVTVLIEAMINVFRPE